MRSATATLDLLPFSSLLCASFLTINPASYLLVLLNISSPHSFLDHISPLSSGVLRSCRSTQRFRLADAGRAFIELMARCSCYRATCCPSLPKAQSVIDTPRKTPMKLDLTGSKETKCRRSVPRMPIGTESQTHVSGWLKCL